MDILLEIFDGSRCLVEAQRCHVMGDSHNYNTPEWDGVVGISIKAPGGVKPPSKGKGEGGISHQPGRILFSSLGKTPQKYI